jgi:hypothetical protein
MNKFLMTAALISAFTFAANDANADNHGEHKEGKMMERVDTDADGRISKAEFMAKHEQKFTEMDTNADGFLSADEMKEAKGKMKQRWEEKKSMMDNQAPVETAPVATPAPATDVAPAPAETPAAAQ